MFQLYDCFPVYLNCCTDNLYILCCFLYQNFISINEKTGIPVAGTRYFKYQPIGLRKDKIRCWIENSIYNVMEGNVYFYRSIVEVIKYIVVILAYILKVETAITEA